MRRLLFESLTMAFVLACTVTGWSQSPSITVLTGTIVHCDSAGSGGHPAAVEWVATPPGESPPTEPTSTEAAFDLSVGIPGTWTIDLTLQYDHMVDGETWSSHQQGLIEAKSIVADLDPGPLVVTTTETIDLDGSGSQISDLAVASAFFKVDGVPIDGCVFPGTGHQPGDLGVFVSRFGPRAGDLFRRSSNQRFDQRLF